MILNLNLSRINLAQTWYIPEFPQFVGHDELRLKDQLLPIHEIGGTQF